MHARKVKVLLCEGNISYVLLIVSEMAITNDCNFSTMPVYGHSCHPPSTSCTSSGYTDEINVILTKFIIHVVLQTFNNSAIVYI